MGTVGRHRRGEYPLGLFQVIGHLFPNLPPSAICDLDTGCARLDKAVRLLEQVAALPENRERHQFQAAPGGSGRVSLWFSDSRPSAAQAELKRIRALMLLAEFEALRLQRTEKVAVGQLERKHGLSAGQIRGAIARGRKLRGEAPRVAAHTRRRTIPRNS